jgi:hypothetical protein
LRVGGLWGQEFLRNNVEMPEEKRSLQPRDDISPPSSSIPPIEISSNDPVNPSPSGWSFNSVYRILNTKINEFCAAVHKSDTAQANSILENGDTVNKLHSLWCNGSLEDIQTNYNDSGCEYNETASTFLVQGKANCVYVKKESPPASVCEQIGKIWDGKEGWQIHGFNGSIVKFGSPCEVVKFWGGKEGWWNMGGCTGKSFPSLACLELNMKLTEYR